MLNILSKALSWVGINVPDIRKHDMSAEVSDDPVERKRAWDFFTSVEKDIQDNKEVS